MPALLQFNSKTIQRRYRLSSAGLGRLINFLIENPEQEFYRGKLIIVEAHRIRIRE